MTSVAYGLAFPATRGVLAFHSASFDPTTLFAGNTGGWWDVADMATLFQDTAATTPVTAAGQSVLRINDKSGNGNHLTQATASKAPILRNSGSLWWLEFDGVDDYLQKSFTFNQPLSRVSAAQQRSWTSNDILWDGGVAIAGMVRQNPASPQITLYAGANAASNSGMTLAANHVITDIFNGASSKLAVDNNAYTTGDPGAANPAGATIGGRASAANNADMLWFGAVWIGRVLSDGEIAQCRTFFGAKAGLTL